MSTQHHPFGPSRLGPLADCPGSYNLTLGDEDETNQDSEEGTILHAAVAARITGEEYPKGYPALDIEQREQVEACVEFAERLSILAGDKLAIFTERPLSLHTPTGIWNPYGTVDCIFLSEATRTAWIIDWKFGRSELEDKHAALQMAGYSALVLQNFDVDTVHAYVFQPRLGRTYEATHTNADAIVERILGIRAACLKPNAPRTPSADACRYCSAKTRCPELTAQSFAVAKTNDRLPTTPFEVDALYDKIQAAKKFLKKLEEEVKGRIREGMSDEWTVQEKSGKRKISKPAGLYKALASTVDVSEFIALGSWPMAGVRGLSGMKPKEFNELLEPYVSKGDDYTAIVRKRKDNDDA